MVNLWLVIDLSVLVHYKATSNFPPLKVDVAMVFGPSFARLVELQAGRCVALRLTAWWKLPLDDMFPSFLHVFVLMMFLSRVTIRH